MDRIKSRMTSIVLILMLLIVIVASGIGLIYTYKDFYKRNALLRVDPLEFTGVKTADPEADLHNSEIWIIGDSRVKRWPQELLKYKTSVANLGVEGQTSSQVLYRFMNYLETDTPSLVILEVGINDLKIIGLDASLSCTITQQYLENIELMIHLCRESNIRMILISIFNGGKIELPRRLIWNSAVGEATNTANQALRSYSDDDVIFYFDANDILTDKGGAVRPEYQEDFLHINAEGYKALSLSLQELVNKVIKL